MPLLIVPIMYFISFPISCILAKPSEQLHIFSITIFLYIFCRTQILSEAFSHKSLFLFLIYLFPVSTFHLLPVLYVFCRLFPHCLLLQPSYISIHLHFSCFLLPPCRHLIIQSPIACLYCIPKYNACFLYLDLFLFSTSCFWPLEILTWFFSSHCF